MLAKRIEQDWNPQPLILSLNWFLFSFRICILDVVSSCQHQVPLIKSTKIIFAKILNRQIPSKFAMEEFEEFKKKGLVQPCVHTHTLFLSLSHNHTHKHTLSQTHHLRGVSILICQGQIKVICCFFQPATPAY